MEKRPVVDAVCDDDFPDFASFFEGDRNAAAKATEPEQSTLICRQATVISCEQIQSAVASTPSLLDRPALFHATSKPSPAAPASHAPRIFPTPPAQDRRQPDPLLCGLTPGMPVIDMLAGLVRNAAAVDNRGRLDHDRSFLLHRAMGHLGRKLLPGPSLNADGKRIRCDFFRR